MPLPIIMHITYCEQGQSIDDVCYKAVNWGFDGVEFRRKRLSVEETPEDYLDAIAGGVRKSGLKQVTFGYPGADLMNEDESFRESEIESLIKFLKMANERFKLTVCNTFAGTLVNPDKNIPADEYNKHGSYAATDEQWEWAVKGYKIICGEAEKLGIHLAFETHMCYIHDTPAAAKKLVDLIGSGSAGINLDYGNTVYFMDPPTIRDTVNLISGRLYYVHVKNSIGLKDGSRIPTCLGDGEINIRQYIGLLKEIGYNGPICLEAPRSGDREWFAKKDIEYLKTIIKDIGF